MRERFLWFDSFVELQSASATHSIYGVAGAPQKGQQQPSPVKEPFDTFSIRAAINQVKNKAKWQLVSRAVGGGSFVSFFFSISQGIK